MPLTQNTYRRFNESEMHISNRAFRNYLLNDEESLFDDDGNFSELNMVADGGFTYIGSYEVSGGQFRASIRVRRHNRLLGSVFGDIDDYELEAVGDFAQDGEQIRIVANVKGTDRKLYATCRWLAELP